MYTVKIKQWPHVLDVSKGTILDAALAQGVPYPHSCRSGECGHCKTRVLVGEVEHGSYLKEALSDAEREQGYILACRARPKSHIDASWDETVDVSDSPAVRTLKTSVVELQRVAADVSRLRLEVQGEPLVFNAGQYVRLSVGRLPARSYSMANRVDDSMLEFHIRHVPNGLVSGYIANELRVGDGVQLEGPFGSAYLRQDHSGPIIAAGGGTGLAPVLSIVKTALMNRPKQPIHLYFGVNNENDIYAEQELRELSVMYPHINTHIVLSRPEGPTRLRTGYVHQAVEQDFNDLRGAKIYVCGPPPMVNAIIETATARGGTRDDIHSDPFVPSAQGSDFTSEDEDGLLHKISKMFKFKPETEPGPEPEPAAKSASRSAPAAEPKPLDAALLYAGGKTAGRVIPACLQRAQSIDELLPWLYLNGVSLAQARQLKSHWQRDYAVWTQQTLGARRYLYWWADGVYVAGSGADERTCVLMLVGVTEHGRAEFIAFETGERQSEQSWLELLTRVQQRGLSTAPRLAVGDHGLGLWGALQQLYKSTQHQYCWHYETQRVLHDLAPLQHSSMRAAIRSVWTSPIRLQAEQAFYPFLQQYWEHNPKAAERMECNQQALLQFYDFPNAHRRYLHSVDFIRKIFSGLQVEGGAHNDIPLEMWPVLLHQIGKSAEKNWPQLKGFNHQAHIKTTVRGDMNAKLSEAARVAA